jgi:hypothetical protein
MQARTLQYDVDFHGAKLATVLVLVSLPLLLLIGRSRCGTFA